MGVHAHIADDRHLPIRSSAAIRATPLRLRETPSTTILGSSFRDQPPWDELIPQLRDEIGKRNLPSQPLARTLRQPLAKFGNVLVGGRPLRIASIAVEYQRACFQLRSN